MSTNFDQLLTFPTLFVFRIIAKNKDGIVEECSASLLEIFSTIEGTKQIPSKSGKYLRIQLVVTALDGAQLYRGYDALKTVEGIRMVF